MDIFNSLSPEVCLMIAESTSSPDDLKNLTRASPAVFRAFDRYEYSTLVHWLENNLGDVLINDAVAAFFLGQCIGIPEPGSKADSFIKFWQEGKWFAAFKRSGDKHGSLMVFRDVFALYRQFFLIVSEFRMARNSCLSVHDRIVDWWAFKNSLGESPASIPLSNLSVEERTHIMRPYFLSHIVALAFYHGLYENLTNPNFDLGKKKWFAKLSDADMKNVKGLLGGIPPRLPLCSKPKPKEWRLHFDDALIALLEVMCPNGTGMHVVSGIYLWMCMSR